VPKGYRIKKVIFNSRIRFCGYSRNPQRILRYGLRN